MGKGRIISFGWTVEALLAGWKWCTRRCWKDSYAETFHAGDVCQAYDRSPRVGGERVGWIRLVLDPYKEPLALMTDEEERAEGGMWGSAEAFIEAFCAGAGVTREERVWVVRFELIQMDV